MFNHRSTMGLALCFHGNLGILQLVLPCYAGTINSQQFKLQKDFVGAFCLNEATVVQESPCSSSFRAIYEEIDVMLKAEVKKDAEGGGEAFC